MPSIARQTPQWNWLGHILRMDERRTVRQVLLNCVKPTQKSIRRDQIDKDMNAAIRLARGRIEWKSLGPRIADSPTWGIKKEHVTSHFLAVSVSAKSSPTPTPSIVGRPKSSEVRRVTGATTFRIQVSLCARRKKVPSVTTHRLSEEGTAILPSHFACFPAIRANARVRYEVWKRKETDDHRRLLTTVKPHLLHIVRRPISYAISGVMQ